MLEVVTPDGRHLKSRPLGVSYDDGNNTVMIATLKHSSGVLTSSNQVTYFDAFAGGIKADLVCNYRLGGFESDLVFRAQPSTPDAYGLTGTNSTLQMITEFFNTADPQQVPAQDNRRFGLQDNTLKFGGMTMVPGRAFAVNAEGGLPGQSAAKAGRRKPAAKPVYKSWLHLQGRTFLIEEVPLIQMAADFDALPLGASIQKRTGFPKFASQHREFPPAPGFVADTNRMLIAAADLNQRPGVVLDYNTVDSDQTAEFTFQNGVTYYVMAPINFYAPITFRGGSVIKINEWYGGLNIYSNINNQSDPSNPTVITSANDDSVGEAIPDNTGQPSYMNNTMNIWTSSVELDNFRFNYATEAFDSFYYDSENENVYTFWNCEFADNCGTPSIYLLSGHVDLRNMLGVSVIFYGANGDGTSANGDVYEVNAQQVTSVNRGCPFISSPGISSYGCFNIKNSIIIREDGNWFGPNWDDPNVKLDGGCGHNRC